MVVQDPAYGTTSIRTTPSSKPSGSGRGLVSSRVQFFEESSNYGNSTGSQRQPAFFVEQLPKQSHLHTPRPHYPTNTTTHGGHHRPSEMFHSTRDDTDHYSESREPSFSSVAPPSRRRRYPDSFSNDQLDVQQQHPRAQLPVISEHRQETAFPEQTRSEHSGGGSGVWPKRKNHSPLLEVGMDHYHRQEFVMAEKAFKTALKTEQANNTDTDAGTLQTALLMGNLGAVYLKLNKLPAAHQFLQSSLEMKKKLTETTPSKKGIPAPVIIMSDTYNNLGNCTYLMGQLDDSLDFYRLALQELREKQGQKTDVADTLYNIGRLEMYRGNLDRARDILQEASRMAKEAYHVTNPVYMAEVSDLMGFVQLSLNQTEEAVISFTKSLEIYRNLYGPIHLDVANAIFNIGLAREAASDYIEAWEAYNTVLDLHRRLGSSLGDADFKKVRTSMAKVEKLISQQQSQAQLVQKHQEAIKKKKKPKEKQTKSRDSEMNVVGGTTPANTLLSSGETRQL